MINKSEQFKKFGVKKLPTVFYLFEENSSGMKVVQLLTNQYDDYKLAALTD